MSIAEPEIGQLAKDVSADLEPGAGVYERIKPALDFTMGLILLILTAPLLLAVMLVVRLTSRGPAIYTQKRLGLGGRVFTIYKIRTMYLDSERQSGPTWSVPGDPRVTPVGRILRTTHLDELPQLINVLLGEMSLVGPRPRAPRVPPQARARPARLSPPAGRAPRRHRFGAGAAATRHRPRQRPAQAPVRPLLRGTDGPLAGHPHHPGHRAEVHGNLVRLDRPAARAPRPQRQPRARIHDFQSGSVV